MVLEGETVPGVGATLITVVWRQEKFWGEIYNVAAQRQKLTLNLHRFWGSNGWGALGVETTV